MISRKNGFSSFKITLILLYLVSFALIAYFVMTGADFYLTSFMERPHHSSYRSLRPAGVVSHGLGVIGSLMMLFMLLYSVRKRTRIFKNFGFLSRWLNLHIYFGIIGPLLIVLHSTFKVHGLIAVSFWSMVAVALSGILGRYLYIQIPRTISGKELSLGELNKLDDEITDYIHSRYQLDAQNMSKLVEIVKQPARKKKGSLSLLLGIIFSDIFRPFRYYQLKRKISKQFRFGKKVVRQITKSLLKKELLERRINQWSTIQQLFHYWHVIHKPFAIIMYIIMLIHIMVAIYVGYIWIL